MAAALSGGSVETAESLLLNSSAFKSYETALDAAMNMTSTKNALLYASRIVANRDCVYEFELIRFTAQRKHNIPFAARLGQISRVFPKK